MTSSSERPRGGRAYGAGIAVALFASFMTFWTTVVRDDGNGVGFFLLVVAAAVGGFSAWFRAAGMARAMLGVATMQILLGVAIATAPSTASRPEASFKALLFCTAFAALLLMSATFFRAAAKASQRRGMRAEV